MARRGNVLHATGCMLFWAEGSRNRNTLCFTNSDPAMVRFFVGFLRTCFGVPARKVRSTARRSGGTSFRTGRAG
jgi:hypothetical protein